MTTQDHTTIESALRTLDRFHFDTKPLWRDLTSRLDDDGGKVPPESDTRFLLPTEAPSITGHFDGETPECLDCATMWPGYHYSLTPGQRRWFRDFTGMTPSQTVTVGWVEVWPGTRYPRSFKVVSDVHVDPRHRRHLLTEWVVRNPGDFFTKSMEFDREEVLEKMLRLTVGATNVWRASHRNAVLALTGVRLKGGAGDVDVVAVTDEEAEFSDPDGKRVTVNRDAFLAEVTDWENDVATTATTTKQPTAKRDPVKAVAELMAELEKGISL